MRLLWLLVLLVACVPQNTVISNTPLQLYQGGTWQNNTVGQLLLPETPMHVSQQGGTLWVAYRYTLDQYKNGVFAQRTAFGGELLKAASWPQLVYVLDNGIYSPTLGYAKTTEPIKDAIIIDQKAYFITAKGLYQNNTLLYPSSELTALYGHQGRYIFLQSPKGLIRYPDNLPLLIPAKAQAILCINEELYILDPEGISWLSSTGLLVKRITGSFQQLLTDGQRIYTLSGSSRIAFNLNLEPTEIPST